MSNAVEALGLGKQYRIGALQTHDTLRDRIAGLPKAVMKGSRATERPTIWALRDVSFQIPQGQAVGIIGSNGSGKSTLLKLLSRITEPTAGMARIRGRVGALLEVGTGFHPELTGRENIYANGAILGMRHAEIARKLDAIIDFAGVESFIDTPVKRYSSGMRLRLAFSVAAHLEPEILIIDEVLAVGDVEFQKRCLGRMNDVSKEGRTILFVSHQLEMVSGLCDRALWLDKGRLRADGTPAETIAAYTRSVSDTVCSTEFVARTDRYGDGPVRITEINLRTDSGVEARQFPVGEPLRIRLKYGTDESSQDADQISVRLWIEDEQNRRVTCLSSRLTGEIFGRVPRVGCFECYVPRVQLAPGTYRITYVINVGRAVVSDRVYKAVQFEVIPADFFNSGQSFDKEAFIFLSPHNWQIFDLSDVQK
jgi:lipopolysaccharide transport system ATP-binding protein